MEDDADSPNRGAERKGNRARIGNEVASGQAAEESLDNHKRSRQKGEQTLKLIKDGMKHDRICALLDEPELEAIIESMEYFTFEQGQTVVEQGKVGNTFFVTHSGTLEVSVDRKACNTLSAGVAFGGIALIYNCPRTATVRASDACAVWGANGATFQRVLRENAQKHYANNRKFLESIKLFDGLTNKQKDSVCEAFFTEAVAAGSRVVTQGESPTSVYFVKRGKLDVFAGGTVQPTGELVGGSKVSSLGPGDCFGERALLHNDPRSNTVLASGDCELLCISLEGLKETLGNDLTACLHLNLVLVALNRSPVIAHLTQVQQTAIAREMCTKAYPSAARIEDGYRIVVVLDGLVSGTHNGVARRWERGESYETGLEAAGDGRPVEVSAAKNELLSGPEGALLSVLTKEGLTKVLATLGLRGAAGAEEVADYARKVSLVKKVPIFRNLSQEQTSKLVPVLVHHKFKKGENIITQGEAGSSFFVIAAGEVTVKRDGSVIRTMGKNAYFGERALLFDEPRTATIVVNSIEAELWSVEKEAFTQVVKGNMREELMNRIKLQDTSVTLKDVRHIRVVGQGATGVVRLVEHKTTKTRYALKRVHKVKGKIPSEVKRECDLLAGNDHPFIMKLVKTFETPKSVYLLTELITGGELHGAIRQIPTVLSQRQAQFYTGSLLIILEELADRNILYRDLKPENVMLDQQGYLKLIDFGISKKLGEGETRTFTMVGTPHYMAPEVMRGQGYGTPVDIWSCGVMLFEFVCGYLPFADDLDDPTEVCAAVLKAPLVMPSRYKDAAGRLLMQGMMCRNPKKRLGAGPNGFEDLRSASYFKTGDGSYTLFDRIMGRELNPPWVPTRETYCDLEDAAQARLSDAGELG